MLGIPFGFKNSIIIHKHVSVVSSVLSDLSQWKDWSPWQCMEPECLFNLEGTKGEEGHKQSWEGERVGSGSFTLIGKTSGSLIYRLETSTPWRSYSQISFSLKGRGGETIVDWRVKGCVPFTSLLQKMTKSWLENFFDRGLFMLKDFLELGSLPSRSQYVGVVDRPGFSYIGIRDTCDLVEMSTAMSRDFEVLTVLVEQAKLPEPDAYLAFYYRYDIVKKRCDYMCVLAYNDPPAVTPDQLKHYKLKSGQVPSHQSIQVRHIGPYKYLGNAWAMAMSEQSLHYYKEDRLVPWYELYLNSPLNYIPEDLMTEINLPTNIDS